MKRSRLAMLLAASLLLSTGCSRSSLSSFDSTRDGSAVAQTYSPTKSFQMARKLGWEAAVLVQNPPHSVDTWRAAKGKWRQAIRLLEAIPGNTSVSPAAKKKLVEYRARYEIISQRLVDEETAIEQFDRGLTMAWQAAVTVQDPPHSLKVWERSYNRWEQATQSMSSVASLTTLFASAQEKLKIYRANSATIRHRLQSEKQFLSTVKDFSTIAVQLNRLQTQAVAGRASDPVGINYQDYQTKVRSLRTSFNKIKVLPSVERYPGYTEMQTAISDYEFAATVWQAYLRHKQANAYWLRNEDFFNQLLPVALVDRDRLLNQYDVKVYPGLKEDKVPLKFTLWAIWEKAIQHSRLAEQQVVSLK